MNVYSSPRSRLVLSFGLFCPQGERNRLQRSLVVISHTMPHNGAARHTCAYRVTRVIGSCCHVICLLTGTQTSM
jgi:hypothetical protein